ncbi:hypothetical protein [Sphingomonas baiyangensis]|uniref:Uncharacterized protein n=1 Tax=Sphingomonas baiyangensis TaxID=2572576 RepID=A0A4V5PTH4_9SPHN|nr:hypothetical protein [Sphingomonas baiyangensis]TKD49998.1 hypothetical protein FBR43_03920 [Sphingomonas baiyangensis]
MAIDMSSLWGVLTIVGPIVLLIAILWAMRHNRGTKHDIERTEAATHRMYDEQDRADKAAEHR